MELCVLVEELGPRDRNQMWPVLWFTFDCLDRLRKMWCENENKILLSWVLSESLNEPSPDPTAAEREKGRVKQVITPQSENLEQTAAGFLTYQDVGVSHWKTPGTMKKAEFVPYLWLFLLITDQNFNWSEPFWAQVGISFHLWYFIISKLVHISPMGCNRGLRIISTDKESQKPWQKGTLIEATDSCQNEHALDIEPVSHV